MSRNRALNFFKAFLAAGLFTASLQVKADPTYVVYTAYELGGGCGGCYTKVYSPCSCFEGCAYRKSCDDRPIVYGSGEVAEYAWVPDPFLSPYP